MLIGVNGFAGVGKDTLGDILVADFGFTRFAFADKLKRAVSALTTLSIEDINLYKNAGTEVSFGDVHMTFRKFLQRFGTEMARDVFGDDFWTNQVIPVGVNTGMWHRGQKYVITDARFNNELRAIRRVAGYNVRVLRPTIGSTPHASEAEPDENLIDEVIINDSTIADFRIRVHRMIDAAALQERIELGSVH